MPNEKMKKLAGVWFIQAKNDYKSAKVVLTERGYYGTTCFLSQQIAEKCLKGFLIYNGKEFTKTHDLVKLLNDCKKINKDLIKFEQECVLLNDFYIESRYPLDAPIDYTKKEAKEALTAAEKIMNLVLSIIDL